MIEFFIFAFTFFVSGIIIWFWEAQKPLINIKYSCSVFEKSRDIGILILNTILGKLFYYYIWNVFSCQWLIEARNLTGILSLPLYLRVFIAIILEEFTLYCIHWIMHKSERLWSVHKWHHSPDYLWWPNGKKASLFDSLIVKSAFLWFMVLEINPIVMILLGLIFGFQDYLVHSNIQLPVWLKKIELIFVTPRFHLVHHFTNPKFYSKNLGSQFTLFDRIFGTYVDPDTIDYSQEEFGLDGEPVTVRMIVGI